MGISVDSEAISTLGADKGVVRIPRHLILMSIPPGHAAFVRTEFLRTILSLSDTAAAIHAEGLIDQIVIRQTVAPAKGFDGIHRNAGG